VALVDAEANFAVGKAYQYTSLTSVQVNTKEKMLAKMQPFTQFEGIVIWLLVLVVGLLHNPNSAELIMACFTNSLQHTSHYRCVHLSTRGFLPGLGRCGRGKVP